MNEDAVAAFIPITAIVMSLAIPIVYTVMDYRRRRDIVEAHHRERMAAIERGVDVPPLPESFYQPISRRPPRTGSTLLPGLVWLFVGIALFVALGAVASRDVSYFGLIPAGIGLAYLIYYFVEGRKQPPAVQGPGEVKGST
jgi:multisubunit Na+/H+ antiporter MnhC subunit